MNLTKFYLFITISLTFLINSIHAIKLNLAKNENSKEGYYLVYINNTDYNNKQKRQENKDVVNEVVQEIHNLIINNKDTYEDKEKLTEIEENHSQLRKRNNESNNISDFVYVISSVKNKSVALAYLSPYITEKVQNIPNVLQCNPDKKIELKSNSYYDLNEIERLTQWKKFSVREDTDSHLSLLSQGLTTNSTSSKYDNNYYYPESAGEGIDIVIIDTGFNFKNPEFSNKDERKTKCMAQIVYGKPDLSISEDECGTVEESLINFGTYHGEWTSDAAAGLKHGVASKANIYGVAMSLTSESNILGALQYVKDYLIIKPNKTVINLSLGEYYDQSYEKETIDYWKLLIEEVIDEGGIVVSSAGNDDTNINYEEKEFIPCNIDDVICVGAIDNIGLNLKNIEQYYRFILDKMENNPKYYDEKIIELIKELLVMMSYKNNNYNVLPYEEYTSFPEIDDYMDWGYDEDSVNDSNDESTEYYYPDYDYYTDYYFYDTDYTYSTAAYYYDDEATDYYYYDDEATDYYYYDEVEVYRKMSSIMNEILYDYYMENSKNITLPYKYQKAYFSNYGDNVNIYAPGFFYGEYQNNKSENKDVVVFGTSFSSPIVVGVIATIMSEHPEIEFTSKSMMNYLKEIALKDAIEDIPKGPNLLIKNYKRHTMKSEN